MIFYESKSNGCQITFTPKLTSGDYIKTRTFIHFCVQFGKTQTQTKHKLYEVTMKPSVSWTLDFFKWHTPSRMVENASG